MKSIVKNLVAALLLVVSIASAKANVYPTVELVENKTVVLNLNDWSNANVEVTIREVYGDIIYNDEFQSGGKRFNLTNVPAGEYELVIESSTKKAIQKMTVLENGVIIKDKESQVIFKPVITVVEGRMNLNQLTLGRDITFSLRDENGVFYSKKFEGQTKVNTRFDISSLPAGDYLAEVKGENQYEVYSFKK